MENAPRLYDAVFSMLGQHRHWRDVRHLKTLCWMVVGLILSSQINLTDWLDYTRSRAMFAQSIQRRFSRWLNNTRIQERKLYAPLIRQALSKWKATRLVLALDTSLLWNRYCLIRVSLIYRGRAIPVMWKVIPHKSSSVAHSSYSKLLYAVATVLPQGVEVLFLADRGFADIALQGATAAAQVALSHSDQVQFLSLSRQAWTSHFELSIAPWRSALFPCRGADS